MVVSLETFKKCITAIEEQMKKDDSLGDLLVDKGTTGWVSTAPELIDCVVDLLQDNLDDEGDWIGWWLWEKEEGKSDHIWTDFNDETYRFEIKDVEDLYYLILDELENIKEKYPEEPPKDSDIKNPNFGKLNNDNYEKFLNEIFGDYKENGN